MNLEILIAVMQGNKMTGLNQDSLTLSVMTFNAHLEKMDEKCMNLKFSVKLEILMCVLEVI